MSRGRRLPLGIDFRYGGYLRITAVLRVTNGTTRLVLSLRDVPSIFRSNTGTRNGGGEDNNNNNNTSLLRASLCEMELVPGTQRKLMAAQVLLRGKKC